MARILVIDDEPDFRKMMRSFLEAEGHDIIEAENGRDGVEKFQSTDPDVVVTDILMPHQDGIETIRQIRALDANAKVIAVSGGGQFAASAFLMIANDSGADISLQKPFRWKNFMAQVDDLLAKPPKS